MKKYLKIFIILLILFVTIPLIKNTYLFFTYKNNPEILIKEKDKWICTVDRVDGHGDVDCRGSVEVKFINDTTGRIKVTSFSDRITGSRSTFYSWGALSDKGFVIRDDTVRLIRKYIPFMDVDWDNAYFIKTSNDSMFITELYPPEFRIKYNRNTEDTSRYWINRFLPHIFENEDGQWGIFSGHEIGGYKISFSEVVKLSTIWEEWIKLYKEIKAGFE